MLNIEKYKNFVMKNLNYCQMETDIRKAGGKANIDCAHTLCEDCKESFFKWLLSEAKEPILDDVEKEYLSAAIRPFRKMIAYIVKAQDFYDGKQCIRIILQNGDGMHFPYLDDDAMYKGMEVNKDYSLKELGL